MARTSGSLLALALLLPQGRGFHFADPTERIVHAFDDALPKTLVTELFREAKAAHDWEAKTRPAHLRDSKASTNWMPIENFDSPRSFAEVAITYLHKMAFPDDSPWSGGGPDGKEPTQLAGAEWWVQLRNPKENIGFHYDKDEGVASEEQWMKMPTMSSVFYLTDAGAPTLVLNKTTNRGGNQHLPVVPHKGYFSYPRKNRYFMFKGDLGHGVVGTLGSKKKRGKPEQRLTFLVNWWDKMPMEPYCRELTDRNLRDMVGQDAMDRAVAAWPDARARAVGYESTHRLASLETLTVDQGSAVLDAGTDNEKRFDELLLQEISQPQTVRYFFDLPKPAQMAARELYEVQWEDGHVYGNVDELDPLNGMVMRLLPHQSLPKVYVWMEKGEQREQYERSAVLPVATENVDRFKFYTAKPSATLNKLKEYGLSRSDCPTVVIHDEIGALGNGNRVYMPPPQLQGKLDLEALRRFLKSPLGVDEAEDAHEEDSPNGAFLLGDEL